MGLDAERPRPSSTVVLVRSTSLLPEVFMVKRHARASFGSRFAFPGGVLEQSDAAVSAYCQGVSATRANALLDLEQGGLAYYSAAIRELFEESGVLLAEHGLSDEAQQAARDGLNAGSLDWLDFVAGNKLTLQCDRLHYFSYWITPVGPTAQAASHDGSELTESCWMSARDVLAARKQKKMKVPYPTRKTLKRVAEFSDVASLLAWAKACGEQGVICDQPAFRPEELL